jgi:aminopeptidase YwaD
MKVRLLFVLAIMMAGRLLVAQQGFDFSKEAVIDRLRQDIEALASEEMEGRESGTPGEIMAAEYVRDRMLEIGLQPLFGDSWFQEFSFAGSWEWDEDNVFRIGEKELEHGEDFFTLPGSASVGVEALVADVGYGLEGVGGFNDYEGKDGLSGKIFLMEYYLPVDAESGVELNARELMALKIRLAQEYGAAAILFKNELSGRSEPRMNFRISAEELDFPVMFLREEAVSHIRNSMETPVSMTASISRPELPSVNVGGYLDNGAATTVVIGGHYDHLGYGGRGSRSPGEALIHYGADDNASGTAGVLEAARYLLNASHDNNNYIFLAFGAEEKGLVGSRYFANSDAYDMGRVNYMFNLDMIGRLTDSQLTLIGTGSSPDWDALIDSKAPDHLKVNKSPGGLGGSDHSSFYMKDIPVIFFFTGIHDDYHRPTDTPDKINYDGAYDIMTLMFDMLAELDGRERMTFSRAPVADRGRTRADMPAMGLMPDHTFEGDGLRVQAVMDGRPAKLAGLQDGDVIIRINDMEVREIQTYMDAMGKLQAGRKITVVVKRGEEEKTIEVQL